MKLRTLRATAIAAAALALAPAAAQAACPGGEKVDPIFAGIGDKNYYFVAPGGTMEGKGFTTTGKTSFVDPQHDFGLLGTERALAMSTGATVTTGTVCVDNARPHLRFVVKPSALSGSVTVEAVDASGVATILGTVAPTLTTGWSATGFVPLASPLAIPTDGEKHVRIRLVATGDWQVDGVAIDPYRY